MLFIVVTIASLQLTPALTLPATKIPRTQNSHPQQRPVPELRFVPHAQLLRPLPRGEARPPIVRRQHTSTLIPHRCILASSMTLCVSSGTSAAERRNPLALHWHTRREKNASCRDTRRPCCGQFKIQILPSEVEAKVVL